MELLEYYRLFRRWLWLIFVAAFIAGSVSFVSASSATPIYRSSATLAIGTFITSPNPQTGEIRLGQDLAQTYAQLLRTYEVMEATVSALNLPMSPGALRGMISTRIVPNTSLLVIQVEYTDLIMTADIANELSRQLILLSPTNLTPQQQAQIDIALDQIDSLQEETEQLRVELQAVDTALSNAQTAEDTQRLVNQRNILYEQINERARNIASFTNTIAGYSQRTNSIEIVEAARIPGGPINPSSLNSAILAAVVGAAVAMGGVLLIEYTNDTFRSTSEVTQTLGLSLLGVIVSFGKKKDSYRQNLITQDLFSQAHEQYRTLRTNMLFKTAPETKKTYIVTSAMPSEGKTLTASNLAISLALADTRVLLIDADMRKPKLHDVFNLPNTTGLSNLLTDIPPVSPSNGHLTAEEKARIKQAGWSKCIQDSGVSNLKVITSGYLPNNPAELLGSPQMEQWAAILHELADVDVVIFDTPPSLIVSDSVLLATTSKAHVILVVEAGRTRRGSAIRAKERFTSIDYPIMGTVFNGVDPRDEDYYGHQGYYYYAYYGDATRQQQKANS